MAVIFGHYYLYSGEAGGLFSVQAVLEICLAYPAMETSELFYPIDLIVQTWKV
jgi:hypothetical protein